MSNDSNAHYIDMVDCPDCDGKGHTKEYDAEEKPFAEWCETCKGSGQVPNSLLDERAREAAIEAKVDQAVENDRE